MLSSSRRRVNRWQLPVWQLVGAKNLFIADGVDLYFDNASRVTARDSFNNGGMFWIGYTARLALSVYCSVVKTLANAL